MSCLPASPDHLFCPGSNAPLRIMGAGSPSIGCRREKDELAATPPPSDLEAWAVGDGWYQLFAGLGTGRRGQASLGVDAGWVWLPVCAASRTRLVLECASLVRWVRCSNTRVHGRDRSAYASVFAVCHVRCLLRLRSPGIASPTTPPSAPRRLLNRSPWPRILEHQSARSCRPQCRLSREDPISAAAAVSAAQTPGRPSYHWRHGWRCLKLAAILISGPGINLHEIPEDKTGLKAPYQVTEQVSISHHRRTTAASPPPSPILIFHLAQPAALGSGDANPCPRMMTGLRAANGRPAAFGSGRLGAGGGPCLVGAAGENGACCAVLRSAVLCCVGVRSVGVLL